MQSGAFWVHQTPWNAISQIMAEIILRSALLLTNDHSFVHARSLDKLLRLMRTIFKTGQQNIAARNVSTLRC